MDKKPQILEVLVRVKKPCHVTIWMCDHDKPLLTHVSVRVRVLTTWLFHAKLPIAPRRGRIQVYTDSKAKNPKAIDKSITVKISTIRNDLATVDDDATTVHHDDDCDQKLLS